MTIWSFDALGLALRTYHLWLEIPRVIIRQASSCARLGIRGDLVVNRIWCRGGIVARRTKLGVLVLLCAAVVTLGACSTPAGNESPEPAATPSVVPSETPPVSEDISPEPSATPDEAPSGPTTTTWTPPADPSAEGPTAAPELPVESGTIDEEIVLSTDMVVSIDSVTSMDVEPETPGERAGSAVVVEVSVRNISDAPQSVDSAVVTLIADDEVGVATTAGPNKPLQGEVAVGETVDGSYVFMLDGAEGRTVTVSVNYAAGEPIAQFEGQVQ